MFYYVSIDRNSGRDLVAPLTFAPQLPLAGGAGAIPLCISSAFGVHLLDSCMAGGQGILGAPSL